MPRRLTLPKAFRVRCIEFVTELPKTISGEVCRVQLRAQEAALKASNARSASEYFEDDFPLVCDVGKAQDRAAC